MNFENFLELVTAPQVAIDATDFALVFGDLDDWGDNEIHVLLNDIITYHMDMHIGVGT